MRILVVGGAGYIGSHVVKALSKAGHTPVVFDDLSTGHASNLAEGIPLVRGSILVEADYPKLESFLPFDGVVHLAALKAAGESMVVPWRYTHHNLTGTYMLLEHVLKWKIPSLVFSSSAAVYGEPHYLPIDEKHPVSPVNYYGYTKRAIEEVLGWYHRLTGLRYGALRYFNAAGYDAEGFPSGLEQNPQNLIPVVMEVAAKKRESVMIFGSDYATRDGTGVRDYIHVSDLARAHVAALEKLHGGEKTILLNLGSEVGASVLEVIHATEAASGQKVPYKLTSRREGDGAELVASSKLAEKVLGWKATESSLDQIIVSTWKCYKKNFGL